MGLRVAMFIKKYFFAAFYFAVIVAATPENLDWWYKGAFWVFSVFLYAVAPGFAFGVKARRGIVYFGIIASVIVLIVTRLLGVMKHGVPYGYDTGFYLRKFEEYIAHPDRIFWPLGWLVSAIGALHITPAAILYGGVVLINIMLGFSVYVLVKNLFRNTTVAVWALFFFAVSIAQYEAYIWMFYRMLFAVALFLVATALLSRRSYAAILVGGVAGALHPASLMVFGSAYSLVGILMCVGYVTPYRERCAVLLGISSIEYKKMVRYWIIAGLGIIALTLLLSWPEYRDSLVYIVRDHLVIKRVNPYQSPELTGFYLNVSAFRSSTLFYLPFALLGAAMLVKHAFTGNKDGKHPGGDRLGVVLFGALFLVTAVCIMVQVIFYQRFLIILDLLVIALAAMAFAGLARYFWGNKSGKVMVMLFVVGFSGLMGYYAWTRVPWLTVAERVELQSVGARLEEGAYGMATDPMYTPWVYGYLAQKTIAPGYLINRWTEIDWEAFLNGHDDVERQFLLRRYGNGAVIYVFIGSQQKPVPVLQVFLSHYANPISSHIWRYVVPQK